MNEIFWMPGMTLEALEQAVIQKAYRFYRNNKTATAQALGISVRTLDNKLERYEMTAIEGEAAHDARKLESDRQLARARGLAPVTETVQVPSVATAQGLHVQPPSQTTAESAVSMSKRPEIQEVSPRQAIAGGSNRRR